MDYYEWFKFRWVCHRLPDSPRKEWTVCSLAAHKLQYAWFNWSLAYTAVHVLPRRSMHVSNAQRP